MKLVKITLTLCTILLSLSAFSQTVDNISWIPQNPTTDDNVKLIVTTSFPSDGCYRESETINANTDPFEVTGFYCVGNPGNCTTTDTFDMGTFTAGQHQIRFKLFSPGSGSTGCTGLGLRAIKNTQIEVSTATSIGVAEKETTAFKLFPNPASNTISYEYTVDQVLNDVHLIVYSTVGKRLLEFPVKEQNGKINLNALSAGSYLIRTESKSTVSAFQKLVVIR